MITHTPTVRQTGGTPLSESALSDLLDAFRHGGGVDLPASRSVWRSRS
jgi:hypothetical protein